MADEEKTKQAFTDAYIAGGKMIPNSLLDSAPTDDRVGFQTLGIERDGTGHKDITSGDIQCSVDMKSSWLKSTLATVDVDCKKDGVSLTNPLSGAEQDKAREVGQSEQPKAPRGNGIERVTRGGMK